MFNNNTKLLELNRLKIGIESSHKRKYKQHSILRRIIVNSQVKTNLVMGYHLIPIRKKI